MVLTVGVFLCSIKMRKGTKGPSIKDVRTFLAHFDLLLPPLSGKHLRATASDPNRSSHQRCSVRKGVLRNFRKFTGKRLYQSLF